MDFNNETCWRASRRCSSWI